VPWRSGQLREEVIDCGDALGLVEQRRVAATSDGDADKIGLLARHALEGRFGEYVRQLATDRQRRQGLQRGVDRPQVRRAASRGGANGLPDTRIDVELRRANACQSSSLASGMASP